MEALEDLRGKQLKQVLKMYGAIVWTRFIG
jgi:hypothetical protein